MTPFTIARVLRSSARKLLTRPRQAPRVRLRVEALEARDVPNAGPVAADDWYTTRAGTPLVVGPAAGVLANDADPDGDRLAVSLPEGPENPDFTLTLDPAGMFILTPAQGFVGSTGFTYVVDDGADCATAVVTVTVTDPGTAVAEDKPFKVYHDTVLRVAAGSWLADSFEDCDEHTPDGVGECPTPGDVDCQGYDVVPTGGLTPEVVAGPAHGTLELTPDGGFTYTPNEGYVGADSFTYRTRDAAGLLSPVRTVSLDVTNAVLARPWRHQPLDQFWSYLGPGPSDGGDGGDASGGGVGGDGGDASGGSSGGGSGGSPGFFHLPVTGDVTDVDTDLDGDPLTVVLTDTNLDTDLLTVNPDGTFTYACGPDWGGGGYFSFKLFDGHQRSDQSWTVHIDAASGGSYATPAAGGQFVAPGRVAFFGGDVGVANYTTDSTIYAAYDGAGHVTMSLVSGTFFRGWVAGAVAEWAGDAPGGLILESVWGFGDIAVSGNLELKDLYYRYEDLSTHVSVGNVSAGGSLSVRAMGIVGDLSAGGDVSVVGYSRIGAVTAGGDVSLSEGGELRSSDGSFRVMSSYGDVGDVTAGGDVWLSGGRDVGDVTADGDIWVTANGDVGDVSGHSVRVTAANVGAVAADEDAWVAATAGFAYTTLFGSPDYFGAWPNTPGDVTGPFGTVGTITAGRDVTRVDAVRTGAITAGRDVLEVRLFDLAADVTGGRDVRLVRVARDLSATVTAETGDVGLEGHLDDAGVFVGRDLATGGEVKAPAGRVWRAVTGRDLDGKVTGGLRVERVTVGNDLEGTVEAVNGPAEHIEVEGTVKEDGEVRAKTGLRWLDVYGDLEGLLTATDGEVDEVRVDRDVAENGAVKGQTVGTVWVGRTLGRPTEHDPEEAATVEATAGAVDKVFVYRSTDEALVKALTSIGTVFGVAGLAGAVTATGGGVSAVRVGRGADEAAAVTAAGPIGLVKAGKTIGGSVKATGVAGTVPAMAAPWDFLADVSADAGDVRVSAGRDVGGEHLIQANDGSVFAEAEARDLGGNGEFEPFTVKAQRGEVNLRAGRDIVFTDATAASTGLAVGPMTDPPSQVGCLTGDAGRSVDQLTGTSERNVWVSARGGDLNGALTAKTGWAYVWAFANLSGSVNAKETVSATAWNDLTASLKSTNNGVEAFGGRNLTDAVEGKYWANVEARGDVSGTVIGGIDGAVVRSGGNVQGKVKASGDVDIKSASSVTGDAESTDGNLVITANGSVQGYYGAAAGEVSIWAGGAVNADIAGMGNIDVTSGGEVYQRGEGIRSTEGSISVQATGRISANVDAFQNAFLESNGPISGSVMATWGNAALLATGDITGSVKSRWVADVRSEGGSILGLIETIMKSGYTTEPDSPGKQRIDVINARILELQSGTVTGLTPSERQALIEALQSEKEVLGFEAAQGAGLNYRNIPAGRIGLMVSGGLATRASEWNYRGRKTQGYVVVADKIGSTAYVMVLEPFRYARVRINEYDPTYRIDPNPDNGVSVVDTLDPATDEPEFYRVVLREAYQDNTYTIDEWKSYVFRITETSLWKSCIQVVIDEKIAGDNARRDALRGQLLSFGVRLIPLVGAYEEFKKADYKEAVISLLGDASMLLGFGAALKARKCVVAGWDMQKIAFRAATGIEAGVTGFRLGQGIDAYRQGDSDAAFGHFGDATLRLMGLSAQAVSWLKNKPICFVAGTTVHAAGGARPIESLVAGDLVWGYDRRAREWQLCRVRQKFENTYGGRLASVSVTNGSVVTGTDGHPVWVVEGDHLDGRGRPDHGADEEAGPTPGRWVPLGDLRVGDVILARSGVTRVTDVSISDARVAVYNLEVEGTHSYAVGGAGLLAHNSDPSVTCPKSVTRSAAPTLAEPAPRSISNPANAVPKAGSTPAKNTRPDATDLPNSPTPPAAGAEAATKSATPATATKRPPRYNHDPRVIGQYKYKQDGRLDEFPGTPKSVTVQGSPQPQKNRPLPPSEWTPDIQAKLDQRATRLPGQSAPDADAAGKLIGEVGELAADEYMVKQVGATKLDVVKVGQGNYQVDRVYKKGDTYYVVEAKGGRGARETSRQVEGEFAPDGSPGYAMQGSQKYLEITLDDMAKPGSPNQAVARQVLDALRGLSADKVVYMNIKTVPRDAGGKTIGLDQVIRRYLIGST